MHEFLIMDELPFFFDNLNTFFFFTSSVIQLKFNEPRLKRIRERDRDRA